MKDDLHMDVILVTQSSMPPLEEYIEEIKDLWDSHWLTNMGPKHNLFKERLIEYLKVDKLDLLVNGHMALELAIQAFNFPKGSEIITTPFTFASTTHAIVRNGLIPVFCDIEPETYTIDVSKIEALITPKTVAILPVHVYGNICDIEGIQRIADKYSLKVIYDAAHAFGEIYKGIGIGQFGDVSIFSFHATKVFNTIEGGAVCYHDDEYGRKLYNLKNFGIRDEVTVEAVGSNAKMNEFSAAMGICNLRHIDEEISKRKKVFEEYCAGLNDLMGVIVPQVSSNLMANYAYYPIMIEEAMAGVSRNDIYKKLKNKEIFTRKYFYPLTCDFECYKNQGYRQDVDVARIVSDRILTLPMYSDLSLKDCKRIIDEIRMCVLK